MMKEKETNFISAVVCLNGGSTDVRGFFSELCAQLDSHFSQYEIVAVDDCSGDQVELLRRFAAEQNKPVTILHMSLRQDVEQCMNAGLDAAIGDYVYEFDSAAMNWDSTLIWEAYRTAMEGNDIVNVCPKESPAASRLFYRLFNASSNSRYPLRTEAFRLVSRRAINRVHAVSPNLPYRKAAYAASGLKMASILYDGTAGKRVGNRFGLAADSLVLYTNAGYRFSIGVAAALFFLAVAELIYTLVVGFGGHPIEGWTTTMFVLTLGFTGVFGVLAIAIKYLSLILEIVFKQQRYFVESIEKIQK